MENLEYSSRRRSLLDETRRRNFLRKSFSSESENVTISPDEYLALLKKEREDWKKLSKVVSAPIKQEEIVLESRNVILPDEFKSVLNARPNYLEMVENARKYVHAVACVDELAKDYKSYYMKEIEKISTKVDDTVAKILAENEELCAVCNDGFCTKSIHPLTEKAEDYPDIAAEFDSIQLSD